MISKQLCGLTVATVSVVALAVTPSHAEWSGAEVTQDGTVHVMNPETPIEPARTQTAKELWRVGGDDEDVLFGVINSVAVDDDGMVYLLDAQLNLVHVISPTGEFLREIGREGQGPGEFQGGQSVFVTGSGNIAVTQQMPSKIIQMTSQGDPLENFTLPSGSEGGPMALGVGMLAGDQVLLSTTDFVRAGNGGALVTKLVRLNDQGVITATYLESSREFDMENMNYDEKRDAAALYAGSPDGRVFVYDDWDSYAIKAYDANGELERVIERDYQPRKRSAAEMEDNKPRAFVQGMQGTRELDSVVSKTDRSVRSIFARNDGTLWVASGRGAIDTPKGVFVTFDVFDGQGRFLHQISIECNDDFIEDGVHFADDKMIVVTGFRSSRRAMNADLTGGDDSEDEAEEFEAMSVICYDLGSIVSAQQ